MKVTFSQAVDQYEDNLKELLKSKSMNLSEFPEIAVHFIKLRITELEEKWNKNYRESIDYDKINNRTTIIKYYLGFEMSRNYSYGIGISM